MSQHSYTRCWLHLIWGMLKREKLLLSKESRIAASKYLTEYAQEKQIYQKTNYVNTDHVHMLIDLPTNYSIEDIFQLLKGSSSTWINKNKIIGGKFAWGRGYGAFSVSHSKVSKVAKYIVNQEEHHRVKTFREEYEGFIKAYGLVVYKGD